MAAARRLERQPRPDPPRRREHEASLRRHAEGADAAAAGAREDSARSASPSATGYTIITGSALFALDRTAADATRPGRQTAAIQPQTISSRGRAASRRSATTRRTDDVRPHQRRRGLPRQRQGLVRQHGERGARARLEDRRRRARTSAASSTTRSSAQPFLRVFIWTIVFAASTVLLSFALGLFLAIALDKTGMRVQRLYRSILVIP